MPLALTDFRKFRVTFVYSHPPPEEDTHYTTNINNFY